MPYFLLIWRVILLINGPYTYRRLVTFVASDDSDNEDLYELVVSTMLCLLSTF